MNLFWEAVKLIVALGAVLIAIVYVIKFGLIRLQPDYNRKKGSLCIVDRLPLNQKSGLFLVRAGEGYFLLGATAESINLLAKVDGEEISPFLEQGNGDEFKKIFNKYMADTEDVSIKGKMKALLSRKFHGGYSGDKNGEK